ncbi:hypothetical protein HPB49_018851 [Dermacentor silvarum]|uniref:Uncharacterized protein n=1 Tax=Dermacentor silvarum TaxID=543639 RepID=A0ACB8CGW3_DERSI|nr:hypothetical protein HPB49_018851 [Dermacentor silvarum]
MLRDRIVCGICDEEARGHLLSQKKLNLAEAEAFAITAEMAETNVRAMQKKQIQRQRWCQFHTESQDESAEIWTRAWVQDRVYTMREMRLEPRFGSVWTQESDVSQVRQERTPWKECAPVVAVTSRGRTR